MHDDRRQGARERLAAPLEEASGLSERARELIGDDYGGIPASVIFVDAEPGQGPRLHKHAYAELFFVLDGQATFTDGWKNVLCAAAKS